LRFLIDNALAPVVAERVQAAGHDAVHVRDYGLAAATDEEIFARAAQEERAGFQRIPTSARCSPCAESASPPWSSFDMEPSAGPTAKWRLLANLDAVQHDLIEGCIVVLEPGRLRLRRLPIGEMGNPH